MRVLHLKTLSTMCSLALYWLDSNNKAANLMTSEVKAQGLWTQSIAMVGLTENIEADGDSAGSKWDMEMTTIVSEEAFVLGDREPWMPARHKLGE